MALDGLNAAAAAAILTNAGVDSETKTRGVIVSAFVPCPLGLAVPLILAQQNPAQGGGGSVPALPPPDNVVVPDVSSAHQAVADAMAALKKDRLVRVQMAAFYDVAPDHVVSQDPPAGRLVRLDSAVSIVVSAGAPPAQDAPPGDIDADLTKKIDEAEKKL